MLEPTLEGVEAIAGPERSLTGQLRNRKGGDCHLPAVGTLGTSPNRAATPTESRPLTISVDEDAALVENAIEKKRRTRLDPAQVSDVHATIGDGVQTRSQIETLAIGCQVDQQIQIRVRILVAARKRAV